MEALAFTLDLLATEGVAEVTVAVPGVNHLVGFPTSPPHVGLALAGRAIQEWRHMEPQEEKRDLITLIHHPDFAGTRRR